MKFRLLISAAVIVVASLTSTPAHAQVIPTNDFSLEVSPSPLATTVEPGHPAKLELKVHNASLKAEDLKIEARDFKIAYPDQTVQIGSSTPPDLAQWVTFSKPTFHAKAGEWVSQDITMNLPEAAGFSYPFVVVISRQNDPSTQSAGRVLKGAIAVFALINIDKPGATRKLELDSLTTSQQVYEFLPATVTVKLKNTGNSIVQPYGNVYIQRSETTNSPLSVLPVNENRSYILPGNAKEITATWADGFPAYKTSDVTKKNELVWDWGKLGTLRIGRYTAKVVAAYNDGSRDVPITGEVTFWVIPWRILIGALVILLLVGIGVFSSVRRFIRRIAALRHRRKTS
jgi:hypothetical protein